MTEVKNAADLLDIIKGVHKRWATGETLMSQHFSRSHMVTGLVCLVITAEDIKTGEVCHGKISLVDLLAGSERSNRSGAKGEQLRREASSINKSLLQLGIVIREVKNGDSMISYRSSLLTQLLRQPRRQRQDPIMFVNVSPCTTGFVGG